MDPIWQSESKKKLSYDRFGNGIQQNTEYGIRNTEYGTRNIVKRYLGRSKGCNGTPRSNTEITCCKLVCVSFSLICHLHFDQPKASHKEFLLKSITTVMLALMTPVMWTFVLICITGTHSHYRYSYSQPGCTPLPNTYNAFPQLC